MNKLLLPLLFASLLFLTTFCGTAPRKEQQKDPQEKTASLTGAEKAFMKNLASLCGKSFQGKETYMQEGRESWASKKFVMHVTLCEEDQVHIPFHLDEDRSRTWMFLIDDGHLRFRHDHRHEDGTPEEQTLYGGYADGTGNAYRQHFPADEYTTELLSDTLDRQWNIVLSEDLSNFSYQLQYLGEIVFQADFDLTKPL